MLSSDGVESVVVFFDAYNPLSIPIVIDDFKLLCSLSISDEPENKELELVPLKTQEVTISGKSHQRVIISMLFLIFQLQLEVFCPYPGALLVRGVSWNLRNCKIRCLKLFQEDLVLSSSSRTRKLSTFSQMVHPLSVEIVEKMPLIVLNFHCFPDQLLEGQRSVCSVEIENRGSDSAIGIEMLTSHPEMCLFGTDSEVFACERGVVQFRKHISLKPQEKVSLTLWIHGCSSGSHHVEFLVRYAAEVSNS